ncbi:energy transducer TonB [Hyphomicrobium sp.]|uniref:energy transducer TonB family protein n=1 Tax=Hyphomicrobium sp. TaxID=82 RepID=UPI0025B7B46F|nr:energy transducer TonB [Hyphomicrobium sp.]MCC7253934.1 energy transducer TonB [Hyphomicrobium sp.]
METADDDTIALTERLVPPLQTRQRTFQLALVLAFLLHAALFIEIGRSVPRTIGDASGQSDAIAVEIVTEADLRSRETVAMPPAGAPAAPATPTPEQPPTPEPTPEPAATPATAPPAPKTPPAESEQKTAALPDFETTLPDLATARQPEEPAEKPPEPAKPEDAKQEPAKPAEKQTPPAPAAKKKPPAQARLDPSPKDFQNAPPGRSAAASRPPGITRSGENDEFGRAVIRALRQTMPPPRGTFGRVTVRLILTENGDLAEVRVLDASGTSLDQSVVFATKQTYFPLPPYRSTVADRTFLITYIYR